MTETTTQKPKMKYKTFSYQTNLTWLSNRTGTLKSKGKPEFRVSSPPEFKGEEGVWTPEDLYIAAIDICTMTTFMAFAEKKKLEILSYDSRAEGMLEFVETGYEFTTVVLRPRIEIAKKEAIPDIEQTLHDAHKKCLIANSVKTKVHVEPDIIVTGENNGRS